MRAIANSDTATAEEKAVAAKLLAELEKPKTPADLLAQAFAGIDAKAAAYRADQLARFKVCSACCLMRQSKGNDRCDLCGASGKWESPLPESLERGRYIAATTSWTNDELNQYIARTSINTALAAHCARVLELRGVDRVRSDWERAGFDIHGHKHGSVAPTVAKLPTLASPSAGVSYTPHS